MSSEFDVIVIGSGFGGAASACRLAEAGKKVLLLERGRRWDPKQYPRDSGDDWTWDVDEPEDQNGWIDLRFFGDMTVAQGAGLGGGSLIYANVSIEAKPEVFDQGWPKEITYQELKPYYETSAEMMGVQTIPDNQMPERFRVMRDGAKGIGYSDRHHKVDLAVTFNPDWTYEQDDPFNENKSKSWTNQFGKQQGTCIHCANCDIGCTVQAKNTLDLNYIAVAENNGAEIRTSHVVSHIEQAADGYTVNFVILANGKKTKGTVTAPRVILAAGSLGSTEILLRSRDEYQTLPGLSAKLGSGWCANGDFITPAIHKDRDINPTQGPTITSAIDLLDGSYKNEKLFIEDGGVPDVLGNYIEEKMKNPLFRYFGIRRFPLFKAFSKNIRNRNPFEPIMVWFGQAKDSPDGRMYLGRYLFAPWKRKLKMHWDYRRSEKVYNAMSSLHQDLAKATNAIPLIAPTWTVLKNIITPHPLGGCGMAASIDKGVVDHRCEVFDYPGLYVMDGSVIPEALGLNPSRTILAISERATKIMLDEQNSQNI
jgi:cholesterol oxidase